jgi:hypothetical protein
VQDLIEFKVPVFLLVVYVTAFRVFWDVDMEGFLIGAEFNHVLGEMGGWSGSDEDLDLTAFR